MCFAKDDLGMWWLESYGHITTSSYKDQTEAKEKVHHFSRNNYPSKCFASSSVSLSTPLPVWVYVHVKKTTSLVLFTPYSLCPPPTLQSPPPESCMYAHCLDNLTDHLPLRNSEVLTYNPCPCPTCRTPSSPSEVTRAPANCSLCLHSPHRS